MNRRSFLSTTAALAALFAGSGLLWRLGRPEQAAAESFPLSRTDAEWQAALSPEAYDVLRQEGTERPGSSPLNHEKRKGTFACAGCDQAVYASDAKFDSGTGWPSFWEALAGGVGLKEDDSLFMTRTEVHCARCGGHLGHVFDDGPPPTGKRHCINGVALTFKPGGAAA